MSLPDNIVNHAPYATYRSSVGEGWFPIVEELHNVLVRIDPDYRVDQVKEKFGGLRYYFTPSFKPITDPSKYATMRYLVEYAEALAARTCDRCSRPSSLRDLGGWAVTRCDDCLGNKESGVGGDVSDAPSNH